MHPIRSLLSQDGSSLAVSREPLSSEVAERLRVLIRNGELPPGTRLVETALADLLKVSRGPVREALRALDREGLVVISPHKGAVVAEWSLQDLLDVYDVRDLLEIRAMELATERAAADCAAELGDLLISWQEAAASGDLEQCADIDFDFHRAIWRHSRNRCLIVTLEQTMHPIQTVFYLNATRYDDLQEVIELHRRMQEGIASGDVTIARSAMEAHMENSLRKARLHSHDGTE